MKIVVSDKVIIRRILAGAIMVAVFVLISYSYNVVISPLYLYWGFACKSLSLSQLGLSITFFLLPIIVLPIYPSRPSDYTMWALYFFSYGPTAIFSFHILPDEFIDASKLLIVLLVGFILFFFSRFLVPGIVFKTKFDLRSLDSRLLLGVSIALLLFVWHLNDFRLNLDLHSIYVRRHEAREIVMAASLGSYFLSFARQFLIPICVYLGVVKKKIFYLLIAALIGIGIFSLDGTKTSILIPCILGAFAWFLRTHRFCSILPVIASIFLIVFLSFIENILLDLNYITDYLIRRIFIVPGILNSFFWEFFSVNPKGMLTDSVMRHFISPVYDIPLTFVIGGEYLNNPQCNANTGIWMGAFAHFGIIGVWFVSVLGGFIVGLIDKMSKSAFHVLGCMIGLFVGIIWSEQMLHTSILTGGIFAFIIFFVLLNHSVGLRKMFQYSCNPSSARLFLP